MLARVDTFTLASNEYSGQNEGERIEYHACVAWDRLAEICGQFLGRQLVDVEERLQTRRWDDDAEKEPTSLAKTRAA